MHAYFKIPKIQRRSAVLWVKILIAVRMARCCGKVMSVVSPAEIWSAVVVWVDVCTIEISVSMRKLRLRHYLRCLLTATV